MAGLAPEHERPAQRVEDLLRDADDVARRREILDERDELVTPEPGDGVAFPQAQPQAPRDLLEQTVAEGVAERIVDELEAVQVEEEERHRLAVALCVLQRVRKTLVEHVAV